MVSLKLLLLLFQAPCRSYQPALEALLLEGLFGYDEVFVAEAYLIFGERKVVVVLRTFAGQGLFIGAGLPIVPFLLFGGYLDGVFIVFGIVRSIIIFGADIAVFSTA